MKVSCHAIDGNTPRRKHCICALSYLPVTTEATSSRTRSSSTSSSYGWVSIPGSSSELLLESAGTRWNLPFPRSCPRRSSGGCSCGVGTNAGADGGGCWGGCWGPGPKPPLSLNHWRHAIMRSSMHMSKVLQNRQCDSHLGLHKSTISKVHRSAY